MKKKLGSIIFMVVCLLLLMNSKVFAAQKGTATITIERFVLGGSYIVEPTTVEFTQGATCEDIFKKVADSKGLKYDISKSTWTGVNYLEGIRGVDCGNHAPKEVTELLTKMGLTIEDNKNDGLYGGSYTSWAGWMFSVNNEFGNESIDQRKVNDGDVIRFIFSLAGGSDINGLTYDGQQLYTNAPGNKNELIRILGKANQETVKSYYKNDKKFMEAYEDANEVMADVVASQYDINDVTSALEVYVKNSNKLDKPTISKVSTISYNQVKLTWQKVKGATGYEVYQYNTKTKKYKKIATVKGTSYTKSGLTVGTSYKFKVRAVNGKIVSSYSKAVSVKTSLAKVTGLTAKNNKKGSVKLTWKKVAGATGYKVYQYNTKTKKYSKIATVKSTSYTKTKLKTKTTYRYKVRAYKNVGKTTVHGSYSSVKSVKVNK